MAHGRILGIREVHARVGIDRSIAALRVFLLRAEAAGQFPKRVRQGRRIGWIEREVDQYVARLARARDARDAA